MAIGGLIIRRVATAIPTLFLVAAGSFALLALAPGDAVDAYFAETAGAGDAESLRRQWGLHGTALQQFIAFMSGAVTFHFGQSIVFSRPVADIIVERLPVTLALMAGATALAVIGGAWLGLQSGAKPGSWRDRAIGIFTLILNAIPNFWLGMMLIVMLAVQWPLFPVGGLRPVIAAPGAQTGLTVAYHLVLPVLSLGLGYLALYVRTLRAGMVLEWPKDHVRAAQARGLLLHSIIRRQVAQPALLPVIALAGQQAGALFGGSVIVETVFSIPGFGRLAYEAVTGRDPALLIGVVLTSTIFVIVANLVVDIVLRWFDPRVRAGDA